MDSLIGGILGVESPRPTASKVEQAVTEATPTESGLKSSVRSVQTPSLRKRGLSAGSGKTSQAPTQQRMRLRDYLFVANVSCSRNYERKMKMLRSTSKDSERKSSLEKFKKDKYQIPKHELYKMIKKEVLEEIQDVVKLLNEEDKLLTEQDLPNPQKEDLLLLYDMRRMLSEVFKPSMAAISEKRQGKIVKQVFNLGHQAALEKQSFESGSHNQGAMRMMSEIKKMSMKQSLPVPEIPEEKVEQSVRIQPKQSIDPVSPKAKRTVTFQRRRG